MNLKEPTIEKTHEIRSINPAYRIFQAFVQMLVHRRVVQQLREEDHVRYLAHQILGCSLRFVHWQFLPMGDEICEGHQNGALVLESPAVFRLLQARLALFCVVGVPEMERQVSLISIYFDMDTCFQWSPSVDWTLLLALPMPIIKLLVCLVIRLLICLFDDLRFDLLNGQN
jgi:hypothetical protein